MYKETDKIGLRPHGGPQVHQTTPPIMLDPWMWVVLCVALVLQLVTLSRIEGYLLADSVEYMDRAAQVAGGGRLDSSAVRSFAFSSLLTPIFLLTDLLGAPVGFAVGLVRALAIALGLLMIWATMRLGARLFGRAAGLTAGLCLAANPVLLQFGSEPLTGSAASLAIVLALNAATRSTGAADAPAGGIRKGAEVGAWLGVALLFAFKTIPVAGVLLAALLFTGRLAQKGLWISASLGYISFGIAQCLLDLAAYGRFGASLLSYLKLNLGGVIGDMLLKLHALGVPGVYKPAVSIYEWTYSPESGVAATSETVTEVARSLTGELWYFERFTSEFIAWPLTISVLIGIGLALVRRRPGALLLATLLVANLVFLSIKPAKSFRLLIPLLPAIALLAGLGLSGVLGIARRFSGELSTKALALFVLGWYTIAGQVTLAEVNLTKFGAWWRAVDELEELAQDRNETWTFSSAYHWAVRFRSGPHLNLVKLPHEIFRWKDLNEEQRQQTIAAVSKLDGFLAHLQILTQDPRILAAVNERFEIHDILFDAASFEELGPLYILTKRGTGGSGRSFFELHKDTDPSSYQASIPYAHSVDFRRRQRDGPTLQMVLLGWELETGLAEGQLAWLTLHWYAGELDGHDYTIVSRITDRDQRSLESNHRPGFGAWPTSKLQPGWILAESRAISLPLDPTLFGGADARGDLIPASFWIAIAEFETQPDGTTQMVGGLNPFQPSGLRSIQKLAPLSPDGYRWSVDGLLGIGGFRLPIPKGARLPDNGQPLQRGPTTPEKD